jgi:hypothetical protein
VIAKGLVGGKAAAPCARAPGASCENGRDDRAGTPLSFNR